MLWARFFSIPALSLLSGFLLLGCSLFDPGGQARKGVEQWTQLGWDKNEGTVTYDSQGPQEAAVIFA